MGDTAAITVDGLTQLVVARWKERCSNLGSLNLASEPNKCRFVDHRGYYFSQ